VEIHSNGGEKVKLKKLHTMIERNNVNDFFKVSYRDKTYDHQKLEVLDDSRTSCTIRSDAFKTEIQDMKNWNMTGSTSDILLENIVTGERIELHRES